MLQSGNALYYTRIEDIPDEEFDAFLVSRGDDPSTWDHPWSSNQLYRYVPAERKEERLFAHSRGEAVGEYADTYGPGESELLLAAESGMACFKLVRMDDTVEFTELLSPNESKTVSFPCGRYVLKIARGETWISDEEAFGENGSYSTTKVFTFEEDRSYSISSGFRGDFSVDDMEGFLK